LNGHTLEDCVFYACTDSPRTANFGAGCLSPWSASGWNTPQGLGVTMQSPLSYNSEHPFAEFNYAPAASVLALANTPKVVQESQLVVSKSPSPGYSMVEIIPGVEWMSLIPKSLTLAVLRRRGPAMSLRRSRWLIPAAARYSSVTRMDTSTIPRGPSRHYARRGLPRQFNAHV
jgi:hypothetical protein